LGTDLQEFRTLFLLTEAAFIGGWFSVRRLRVKHGKDIRTVWFLFFFAASFTALWTFCEAED
jgi:hypothetical protein